MKSQIEKIKRNAGCYECLSLADDDVHELLGIVRQLTELLETAVCPNAKNGCQQGKIAIPNFTPTPCLWCRMKKQTLTDDLSETID